MVSRSLWTEEWTELQTALTPEMVSSWREGGRRREGGREGRKEKEEGWRKMRDSVERQMNWR